MEAFDLPVRRKIRQLSRGMESALGIIIGLASRAPITLFDDRIWGWTPPRNLFYERLLQDYTGASSDDCVVHPPDRRGEQAV